MNSAETKWLDPTDERPIVPHGFRATFRTWAEETTHYPNTVIEEAMGHVVGSAVERAYRRTDVLQQHHALMEQWAKHCEPMVGHNDDANGKSGSEAPPSEETSPEDVEPDEYAPDFDEAEALVQSLSSRNQQKRRRGTKGELLSELDEIKKGLTQWASRTPDEKRGIAARLWVLNSGYDDKDPSRPRQPQPILGEGRYPWREKGRPPGNTIDASPSDLEMVGEARKHIKKGMKVGTALRAVVRTSCSGAYNEESVIKRLRRQMEKNP